MLDVYAHNRLVFRHRTAPPGPVGSGAGMNANRRAFEVAAIICAATDDFCRRFLKPRSPTRGRMVRAVRLCRQGMAEAAEMSRASGEESAEGRPEPEVQQVKAVRSGLGVLLIAYEEYLRERGIVQWGKDDPKTLEVRAVGKSRRPETAGPPEAELYRRWLEHDDVAVVANCAICLIHQANYLLTRQVQGYRYRFGSDGGPDEGTEQPTGPDCPVCGRPMLLRTARRGILSGSRFWGCSGFPACRKTIPYRGPQPG